jgi:hypothetical protein
MVDSKPPGKFTDVALSTAREGIEALMNRILNSKVRVDPGTGLLEPDQIEALNRELAFRGFEVDPMSNVLVDRTLYVRPTVPRRAPLALDDRFAVRQQAFLPKPNRFSHAVEWSTESQLYMDKKFEVVHTHTGRRWGMVAVEVAGDPDGWGWGWAVYDL